MSESAKQRYKKIAKAFDYVGKIISSALLVILVLVGIFLVYYLVSAKKLSTDPNYVPKMSLYTIVSGSMEPNIKVYDVVLDSSVSDPTSIKVGDVITFKSTASISKDLIVTHRVVDIKLVNGKYEYVTKGDWNPSIDSDTAKFENVIGKVILRLPQLGRVQFFLSTKMGWFLVVLLPAMGVIVYDIIKLIKLLTTKKIAEKIPDDKNNNGEKNAKEKMELETNKELNETLEKIKKNNYINQINDLKEDINDNKINENYNEEKNINSNENNK
jgi:signal peptidase I